MKAQLFYLESQKHLKDDVIDLFREHVSRDIEVDARAISDDYSKASMDEEHEAFRSYLKLLMASMITTVEFGDFEFIVGDSQGRWLYMGYEKTTEKFLRLSQELMTSVFPAVAVMNRMVLVPQGTLSAFYSSGALSFCPKPLDIQGVLLVDFEDLMAIKEAVQKVGKQLKYEIERLCRRYLFVNKILQPDLDDLAELLNIRKGFLEQSQDRIFSSPVKLIPRIVSGPARANQRSQVDLEIVAESEEMLEGVRVQVRAPSGIKMSQSGTATKDSVGYNLDFSAGRSRVARIQFELVPGTHPYCPLEVIFVLDDASKHYVSAPVPVILRVQATQ